MIIRLVPHTELNKATSVPPLRTGNITPWNAPTHLSVSCSQVKRQLERLYQS